MRKLIIFILLSLFLTSAVDAKSYYFLFWYPGGSGNQEDAKPYLDAFTDYLNERIAPTKLIAHYSNTEKDGFEFIKKNKPFMAIISYPTWLKSKHKLPKTHEWLSCLTMPKGKSSEKYLFISNSKESHDIYSTFPVSDAFLELAFPNIPKTIPFKETNRILSVLRKIAKGEQIGAILTPDEAHSLTSMKGDWIKNLNKKHSQPVPSAKVFLFTDKISFINDLKRTLKGMGEDETQGTIDILTELRLKGFE